MIVQIKMIFIYTFRDSRCWFSFSSDYHDQQSTPCAVWFVHGDAYSVYCEKKPEREKNRTAETD